MQSSLKPLTEPDKHGSQSISTFEVNGSIATVGLARFPGCWQQFSVVTL
jgi:hypothetical protein